MLFISFLQEGNNFTKKLNKIIISEKVEIYEQFLIIDKINLNLFYSVNIYFYIFISIYYFIYNYILFKYCYMLNIICINMKI